jgi:hypothetical protein
MLADAEDLGPGREHGSEYRRFRVWRKGTLDRHWPHPQWYADRGGEDPHRGGGGHILAKNLDSNFAKKIVRSDD